jgi:hypothetical protein
VRSNPETQRSHGESLFSEHPDAVAVRTTFWYNNFDTKSGYGHYPLVQYGPPQAGKSSQL